ncbi:tripartite tricarboxylate transporter TctB family protein [Tuberibacillus sp. Marseille-P3662]|uniref:tripartite tricarboxylate transporter TctB family protein n=1 Tax=Tuberibacillus sp. Marseille-P3662 TaxID=1965358 RepID=UPI000A1C8A43|nr:tripartite tricarboxylate transporter TctB family protein [Tuberibacillus sp. Marseille-P3662]
MRMKTAEIASGIAFIILGVIFLFQAIHLPAPLNDKEIGPGAFPKMMAVLVIVFSILLILRAILKSSKVSTVIIKRFKNIVISMGIMIIFGLTIPHLGIYLSSAIYFPVMLLLAGQTNWKSLIGVTLLFELFAFVIFDSLLKVPLP